MKYTVQIAILGPKLENELNIEMFHNSKCLNEVYENNSKKSLASFHITRLNCETILTDEASCFNTASVKPRNKTTAVITDTNAKPTRIS